MLVYAVVLNVHYESGSVAGMFADFESATEFGKNHPCYNKIGYDLGVVTCALGAAVDQDAQTVWL